MKNNINNNYNVSMEKTQFKKRQHRQPEILRHENQTKKEKKNEKHIF